ncbi:unnamed protein product, partial [Didymodactylos carnosus]
MKLVAFTIPLISAVLYISGSLYVYSRHRCKLVYDYPFQDPTLPVDVRLDNLMSLLTPEEKIDMLWMDTTTP